MTLENIIRSDLLKFNAYSSARDEAKNGRIWLNANESPFSADFNRYPEKQSKKLVDTIAYLTLNLIN
jgi:histidinol-phosphate/aromatic aminotransferase/cobyric acid decarboxylase-like protein